MDGRQADPGVLVRQSWAERVNAAVGAGDAQRAAQAVESARNSLYYDVRPVEIRGNSWTRVEAYRWRTEAVFYNEHTGKAETSFVFDLWAFTGSDPKIARFDKVMAIWRGRWEAITQSPPPAPARYVGGYAIEIYRVSDQGNLLIDNAGIRSAKVTGDNTYEDANGTLFFNPRHFQWTATGDMGGKRQIALKTKIITVSTPTGTEQIEVIGS